MSVKLCCSGMLLLVLLVLPLCLFAQTASPPQPRLPWPAAPGERSENWLVCGLFTIPADETGIPQADVGLDNDYLQGRGGEETIRPSAGMSHQQPDGTPVEWKGIKIGGDSVDFLYALHVTVEDIGVAYAFTTISRKTAGNAVLMLGSNDSVKIWVNGKPVHRHYVFRGEPSYEDLVVVPLFAGENSVLVKLVQRDNPGGFSLRVLEVAQAELYALTRPRLSPAILPALAEQPDALTVATDTGIANLKALAAGTDAARSLLDAGKQTVAIRVVDPAGKTIAGAYVPRGEQAHFAVNAWPAGPYELRLEMTRPDGIPVIGYLLWYHGDALAAAKQVLDTAPVGDDPSLAGMQHAMLSALIKDRLGEDLALVKPERLPDVYPALMEYAEDQAAAEGRRAPAQPGGFMRLAYRDEIDGSAQFCRVYLPAHYRPGERYPLIISLHGRSDAFPPYIKWGGIDQRHDSLAEQCNAIVAYPHARGNTWYRGMGDQDVMRCVELVKQQFSVDDDRVYLLGYSMGGAGVWYVGSRHPDVFAALAPNYGGYDYRFQLDAKTLDQLTARLQYRRERISYLAQAEGLRTTPVFNMHGDKDNIVQVDYSRFAVRMLERWGYNVRYWEQPGKGHGGLYGNDIQIQWLLAQRRAGNPARVSLRAAELRSASAHWVQVLQREDPYLFMQADAEVVAPNIIRLDTANVLEIALSPRPPLIDPARPVQVFWNGTTAAQAIPENGRIVLRAAKYTPPPLCKRPGLEGPAQDLFTTPFLVVTGTISPDPLMRAMCRRATQRFTAWWDERFHSLPRVMKDTEVTEADMRQYSLLLIGGFTDNLIAKAMADKLPLKIAPNAVTIDKATFAARDAAVQMVYPHPLNPDRYVVIRAATSPAGMFYTEYVLNDVDFSIVDRRNADPDKQGEFFDIVTGRNSGPRLLAGYFDNGWQYKKEYIERDERVTIANFPVWKVPRSASADPIANRLPVSDLVETNARGSFLDMLRDCSMTRRSLELDGKHYATGLAVTPRYWLPKQSCFVEYDITGGEWTHLRGTIGLETTASTADAEAGGIVFVVKGDGVELYRSDPFTPATPPQNLDIDVTGVKVLRLEVVTKTPPSRSITSVDWADLTLAR